MSVCSGSALLAKAGLLDGRRATSNKQYFKFAVDQGPKVTWVKEARWVDDGNRVTSSGVSAGMDMALHVIARLYGARRSTRPIDRFARILFATDLTEGSRPVLEVAASIARKTGASLEAVCVFGEGDEQPADGGRKILENFFAKAGASEYLGNFHTIRGGVADALVEYASAEDADLIAITTALCCGGDTNLTATAEYIIRNAPCPVLSMRT